MNRFLTYNLFESVLDKMTPKPMSDVYGHLKKYLDRLQTPLSYYNDQNRVYNKISKLFGVSRDELFVMDRYNLVDSDFDVLHKFFRSIVNDQESVIYSVETKTKYIGRWSCYPKQKLALFTTMDFYEKPKWIVYKKYFEGNVNESLRDKMTPKSGDDIYDAIKKLPKKKMLEFFHTNPQMIPQMNTELKKELMEELPPFSLLTDIVFYKMKNLFTTDEIENLINKLPQENHKKFFKEELNKIK